MEDDKHAVFGVGGVDDPEGMKQAMVLIELFEVAIKVGLDRLRVDIMTAFMRSVDYS